MFVGLRGNKIWKFLNLESLKEEVSVDVQFNEFKFPTIADDAAGQLLRRLAPAPAETVETRVGSPTKRPVPHANLVRSSKTLRYATTCVTPRLVLGRTSILCIRIITRLP